MTKPTKWHVRPAKTQISLGIRPVWSESSLSVMKKAWVLSYPLSTQRRLIRLGGCPGWAESSLGAVILLVLSCCGSYTHLSVSLDHKTNYGIFCVSSFTKNFIFFFFFNRVTVQCIGTVNESVNVISSNTVMWNVLRSLRSIFHLQNLSKPVLSRIFF